jgi:hypothetical protein
MRHNRCSSSLLDTSSAFGLLEAIDDDFHETEEYRCGAFNPLLRLSSFLLRISRFYRAETTALAGEARLRIVRIGKPNVAKEIQSHGNWGCNKSICDNNLPVVDPSDEICE